MSQNTMNQSTIMGLAVLESESPDLKESKQSGSMDSMASMDTNYTEDEGSVEPIMSPETNTQSEVASGKRFQSLDTSVPMDLAPQILSSLSRASLGTASMVSSSLRQAASEECDTRQSRAAPLVAPTKIYGAPAKGTVQCEYVQMSRREMSLQTIVAQTPPPKGKSEFSSVHLILAGSSAVHSALKDQLAELECPTQLYELAADAHSGDPIAEYNALFAVASDLILQKADRASLLVFVGEDHSNIVDGFAALIGMLPFRGCSTALVSLSDDYGSLESLQFGTRSGVFEFSVRDACRMGLCPVAKVFGPLPSRTLQATIADWDPVKPNTDEHTVQLPFKIGGLTLPMLTYTAAYEDGVEALASRLTEHYFSRGEELFHVVSCGETVDKLGYGADISAALSRSGHDGFYFPHRSGESFKRHDVYGDATLLRQIMKAKHAGKRVVMIAVGGGVNGNCSGLIAALTGADFIEVPTTPMHYNDATTSAKKAFSLVVDDVILSKNILGAFYLPQLVFCINETLLTINSANAHATVGEATKTMNMLGIANSRVGKKDYSNIMGAAEFDSDFTKILSKVAGFECLVEFIEHPDTLSAKQTICELGRRISELRSMLSHKEDESVQTELDALVVERHQLGGVFRDRFNGMKESAAVQDFLTTINLEVVKAKAMFLAYSDPFEKYRALLFEYAHTLGHGVEAFMNGLYLRASREGKSHEYALKLHGQCVGMAVLWAGHMSSELGVLEGEGMLLHQSFVYLFNRFGGFSFGPLRRLCDELGVSKEEFCEGVLKVVRRDNKRGYTACGCGKSVDQLVCGRPGKMLKSDDYNAELRYLVEVDEQWQERVLSLAFDGTFDKVADISESQLHFKTHEEGRRTDPALIAESIRTRLEAMYAVDEAKYIKPVSARNVRRGGRPQVSTLKQLEKPVAVVESDLSKESGPIGKNSRNTSVECVLNMQDMQVGGGEDIF